MKGVLLSEIKNPSVVIFDEISDDEFSAMIDSTISPFDEGDLVTGTIVKIDHAEVGFQSE